MPDQGVSPIEALVALGSNIRPELHLPSAVKELASLGTGLRASGVWESAPVGFVDQPNFCNAVVRLRTLLPPLEIRLRLREIEERLGRVRDPLNKNGPRTIDLDLVLYGDVVANSNGLVLPDHELPTRPFLAVPAAEVAPDMTFPLTGEILSKLAGRFPRAESKLHRRTDITLWQ